MNIMLMNSVDHDLAIFNYYFILKSSYLTIQTKARGDPLLCKLVSHGCEEVKHSLIRRSLKTI